MDLTYLRSFLEVARCQSFTKAADRLGYAQSSVTAHIQKLENEYGVVLFERYGRTMRLTSAGEQLHGFFEQIVTMYDESKHLISRQVSGRIDIGTIESLMAYFLPPVFSRFRECFPQINLQVKPLGEQLVLQSIKTGDLDMGVIMDRIVCDEDIESIPLRQEPLVLVAPPDHPLRGCNNVSAQDLQQLSYIATEPACTYRNAFEQVLSENGVAYRILHELGSLEAIKRLVAYGHGVALLPRITVERELTEGQLIVLPFSHPDIIFYTQIVIHKKKWKDPAIRHLIELLAEAAEMDKRLAL
ncbi:LysR family transcriptional regulator [Cohnella lubricantis]|uniref:LysR family transcriptional regulator n=1 Tax=Cohnella lubricantis TaxID=2163172 RepID=A0A841TLH3_9BACL|nr:LysR family transcriptional regulator [Cohnella lubricantis]MBB6679777.1 LysR family transcriptional regulator [Cohnella lubricantis]MBP2119950.1 DNA-binding transcriptional LysR family regulator [Cohnella lubricantis]